MQVRNARRVRLASGYTLIELSVVMSIAGIIMAIGAFGFSSWLNTSRHQGTSNQLISHLRNASTLATTEGRTYCVEMSNSGKAFSLWRYKCSTAVPAAGSPTPVRVTGPLPTQHSSVSADVSLVNPLAAGACPATSECVYFYPRGTASEGSIVVASTDRLSKTYVINVEGLTARVYS